MSGPNCVRSSGFRVRRAPVPAVFMAVLAAVSLAILLASAGPVFAQSPLDGIGMYGWGPRLGLTLGPSQFHFGLQSDLGSILHHTRIVPDFEFGTGSDQTITALEMNLFYRSDLSWLDWAPYLGAGPAFLVIHQKKVLGTGKTLTRGGANAVFGIERGTPQGRLFFESQLGVINSPDFRATVGYTFMTRRY